jgi:molybdopterin molybdotransferase
LTEFETRSADWLSVEDALGRVLSSARPGPVEKLPLHAALGRALAAPITARATLPPWDNSAMDGYAVRGEDVRGASADAPAHLPVSGVARAGATLPTVLARGSAVRIMTGAPLPPGADSVIRVEDTDRESGAPGVVEIRSDRDAGRNVRPGGQDMRAGEVVLGAGATLGPGQLAVAAAAGHAYVDVHQPPRVAVLSNGDELRTLDEWDDVLSGAAVPETNGLMLVALVSAAGGVALPPRLARDTHESIGEQVAACANADVLITSGGASMGEADLFKRVLDELGLELVLWRVTLRPGSPFSFGLLPRVGSPPQFVFGLPGNPTSAFVTFELFVRPFLLRSAGHARIHRPILRAVTQDRLPAVGRLTHYHRVLVDFNTNPPIARLTGPQGSGLVQSLGKAQGLAVVPLGVDGIEPGEPVDVLLVGDAPATLERPGYRSARP